MILKRGTRFIHNFWLDDKNQPLRCEVTAVRHGLVYWKQDGEAKAHNYFSLDAAHRFVKELLEK